MFNKKQTESGYMIKMSYDETTNTFNRYICEVMDSLETFNVIRCECNNECKVYVKNLSSVIEDDMKKHILESYKYTTMLLEKVKQEEEMKISNTIAQINHKKEIIKKLSYLEREKKLKRII